MKLLNTDIVVEACMIVGPWQFEHPAVQSVMEQFIILKVLKRTSPIVLG